MMTWLHENLPPDFVNDFQIIPSRLCELDESKWRILWCHDLAEDPSNEHLQNDGWKKFHRIVFVSYFQREQYFKVYNIPPSKTMIMQNAIYPIPLGAELAEKIRLIYHTTPHRGLEILVPVFEELHKEFPNIHLDVFSSFGVYGWEQRDKPFEALFGRIKNNSGMTYHGSVKNAEIREHLKNCHIFAYPSIWPETSCISLMEAMSAGLMCVHPNFAALPETAANWTAMYPWHEDRIKHASIFYNALKMAIENIESAATMNRLHAQKSYADTFYSWDLRKVQWQALLESIKNEPKEIPKGPVFVYNT